MEPEERLDELGIELPDVAEPVADYVPAVRTEDGRVYVSGQLPTVGGELAETGKVGEDVSPKRAKDLAQRAAINILAAVDSRLDSLSQVTRVVRVEGFVASADGFTDQPTVVNGASELFGDVFGDAGKHSRFAVGCNVLPLDTPVEIGAIFEVEGRALPAEADAERQRPLAETLSSLSNPARLAILNLLQEPRVLKEIRVRSAEGDREHILARQTIREHLDQLVEEGFVLARQTERSYGSTQEYVLDHRRLFELSETMRELARRKPDAELGGPTRGEGAAASPEMPDGPGLVLVGGLEAGRTFELSPDAEDDSWIVGRRRDADIPLDYDPFVSADNTEIRYSEDGFAALDLPESRNGTRLNFEQIEPGEPHLLRCGDLLGIGRSLLLFRNRRG